MNRRFLTLLALLTLSGSLLAQNSVRLTINSITTVVPAGQPACVPIIADSLSNIVASEFSVAWDTAQLEFAEIRFGDSDLPLDASNTVYRETAPVIIDGEQTMEPVKQVWAAVTTPGLQPVDVEPGTVLMEICFLDRDGDGQATSEITFDGRRSPEFVEADAVVSLPFTGVPGTLSFTTESTGIFTPDAEPDWAKELSIFPNPYTTGPLAIAGERIPALDRIDVLSVDGRQVRSFKGDVRRLDLNNLPAGEYTLVLVSGVERVQRMVIKM